MKNFLKNTTAISTIKRGIRTNFVVVLFSLLIVLPGTVVAATISLDPKEGSFGPGDMFMVTVRLDTTPSECVNAVSAEINYQSDWMKATVVSKGESLLSLWTDGPTIDVERGKIVFSGGIPAGYCGRVQGDPGKSNILAKVVFNIPGNMIGGKVATGPVPMPIIFGTGTVALLNDGFGTPAPLVKIGATLTRTMNSTQLKNEWLDAVHSDATPPDSFVATIEHDSNIFEGKYFLAFTTVDKQSGINHYEVREDDPERLDFVRGKNDHAEFVESKSLYYYELKDQELKSRITVRAFDNARNHTDWIIAPLRGAYSRTEVTASSSAGTTSLSRMVLGFLALILLAGVVYSFVVYRKKKNIFEHNVPTHNEE